MTIIARQTLHLTQLNQTSTVCLAKAKLRLIHETARERSMICHSREHVSSALGFTGGILYTIELK